MLYKIARILVIPIIYILYLPKVIGKENIPKTGSLVVYSNHTSFIDPVILGCTLPRKIHFMAKEELFKKRFVSYFLRKLGAFPVKRGKADISSIKNALRVLNKGEVFGIFPEGTRNKSGDIEEFARGIASIVYRSKAKAIPIAIIGGYKVFRPIKIIIGKPVDLEECFGEKSNKEVLDMMAVRMSEDLISMLT